MSYFFKLSLRMRFILSTSFLVTCVMVISSAFFTQRVYQELTSQFQKRIESQATHLSHIAAYGVFVESSDILEDLLKRVMADEEIVSIQILNDRKEVIVDSKQPSSKDEPMISHQMPVVIYPQKERQMEEEFTIFEEGDKTIIKILPEKKIIGYLSIQFSTKQIEQTLKLLYLFIGVLTVLLIAGGVLISFFLSSRVISPLKSLARATQEIASGNLDLQVPINRSDEIGELGRSFNEMTRSLKESRLALEETYQKLAQKERLASLGELTAGIAHEIRNPLGILLASAQIILSPAQPDKRRMEAGEFILDEVKRLDETLTHFLNFARPKELKKSKLKLSDLLRKTVGNFTLSESIEPMIQIKLLLEEVPEIEADGDLLRQVILNLLLNAHQAIQDKGEITIKAARCTDGPDSGKIEILISDTGEGIAPEIQKKVFDPFFTTKDKGTGLGLAMVYQIISMHQGKIELFSTLHKGTTFRMVLG